MGKVAAEWIIAILQNYISEILLDGKENFFQKRKYKKFLKELDNQIIDFCSKNECVYIDSSAFEYFIRSTDFLNKVVERAVSVKIDKSDKEFYKDWIKKAREIAVAENIPFSKSDERLIKDLCHLINEKVTAFYARKLSVQQKAIVAANLKEFAKLHDTIQEIKDGNNIQNQAILKAIGEINSIGDSKAELLAGVLASNIWEGRIKEFETLSIVIKEKSDDLKYLIACLDGIYLKGGDIGVTEDLKRISNSTIRDIAIRTMLPMFFYTKRDIKELGSLVTGSALKEIVNSVVSGDLNSIFTENISINEGIEVHNFELNKRLLYEEADTVKLLAIIHLYEQKLFNTSLAIKELSKNLDVWFTRILIADRRMDSLAGGTYSDDVIKEVNTIATSLSSDEKIYSILCKEMRVLYYGIQTKAKLLAGKYSDVEGIIPDDLKEIRPLADYIYSVKIENKNVDLEDLYSYCVANQTYWMLNNYFIGVHDEKILIEFCKNHEDVLVQDMPLFFLFLGALHHIGDKESRNKYLEKYTPELNGTYEYWNEKLETDKSENTKLKFIEACKDGKMFFIFRQSIYLLIERLINYQMFSDAELYIKKAELLGEDGFRIKKCKAVVEQGKGRHLEAIKQYYEAFAENPNDTYVIDSIISLSLANKRKIKNDVINAAERIGTARLHSLVAECYIRDSNKSKACEEIVKAILLSDADKYNPAFGQYMLLHTSSRNEGTRVITCIDADTVAYCISKTGEKKCICIYEAKVLPTSPWNWNGDYHIYMDDAAAFDFIRKRKNDWITVDNIDYKIQEIAPLDFYLFRTCMRKMTESGAAREISIPTSNGKMDIQAFNKIIQEVSPDEKDTFDWLEQYNNIDDIPLPLYTYKRFTRRNYLQFVDLMLSGKDHFIRELQIEAVHNKKYVITFAALIILYKIGLSVEKVVASGAYIPASTLVQIENDVADIIKEYDRDTVASMGVFEGKVFFNVTEDDMKIFWMKEAGNISKFCKSIPTVDSNNDLDGKFFGAFDSKELIGICDYDAVSIVKNNQEYSLITVEALLSSLHQNELVKLNVISLVDFIINLKPEVNEFILYLSKLMDYGCLMSVSKNAIVYISKQVKSLGESEREVAYKHFNDMLKKIDKIPEKNRLLAIQYITESFGNLQNEVSELEHTIFQILISNMLLFRKQKLQIYIDEKGQLTLLLVDMEPTSEIATVEESK